jgi:lysophospholipase L1-like esterase
LANYRHAKVLEKLKGAWAKEPPNPARIVPFADGVLGLGGMRTRPQAKRAGTRVTLAAGATRGGTHWELAYRWRSPQAHFRVALDGAPPRSVSQAGNSEALAAFQHLGLVGSVDGDLVIDGIEGVIEFMGVTIESAKPGVVVDTVGIDGARIATFLAWDEESWVEEVRHRDPALAVVAFGTNEVLASDPVERYGPELSRLVARLRRANPDLECLLIGPTPLENHQGTHPRVAEIDRVETESARSLGCGYFSPYQALGGGGGYGRWSSESPPLTARDRVHFSPSGYARLGSLVADALLSGMKDTTDSPPSRP